MATTKTPMRSVWLFYVIAWFSISAINLAALAANGLPWDLGLRNTLAYLLPDALLGLAVLQLPQRLPWPDGNWLPLGFKHAGLLLVFVALSSIGWFALVRLDAVVFGDATGGAINLRLLPWRIANDLLVYGTCAGLAYALQNAASARVFAAQVAKADTLRARAQLEVMRNQLNPHFVLNTLHALIGLVGRDPAVAEDALERLGDLLRYSLRIQRDGVDEMPLRNEWSFVQSFIDIERLRLGERLRTRFHLPEDTLDCMVPTFALQTLVENAIKHAVAPRSDGGTIDVDIHTLDGRLRIQVSDEGPGGAVQTGSENNGVGLRLLQERLVALYAGNASLDLQTVGAGTHAVLDLPLRRVGEHA